MEEAALDETPPAFRLLVKGAKQLVQVVNQGQRVLIKDAMKELQVLDAVNDNGLAVIVDRSGKIADLGYDKEINARYPDATYDQVIDAKGLCIVPGLVDAHTHPVWEGDRVQEFKLKVEGRNYLDILACGGGIHYTVEHTRLASERALLASLESRLRRMLRCGTTLVEAKTGYGLDTECELKLLRVIENARVLTPLEISATYCIHAIPRGLSPDQATEAAIHDQLPRIREICDLGLAKVESVDVFCETGVFDVEQTRRILEAARDLGFRLNFHGEELHYLGSAEMGASLEAEAISHLEEVGQDGITAMARVGTVGILLPVTALTLRLTAPPARQMIAAGVPVALGSDFNPNSHCTSMPTAMYLACVMCRLTPAEALVAATLNAAAALGKSDTHGSLESGKVGDMLLLACPTWEHLIYQLSAHDHVIRYVIKEGQVVFDNKEAEGGF